jgi:hypothetical protein
MESKDKLGYAREKLFLKLSDSQGEQLLNKGAGPWRSWGWRVECVSSSLDSTLKIGDSVHEPRAHQKIFNFYPERSTAKRPTYVFCLEKFDGGYRANYFFVLWDDKNTDSYIDRNIVRFMVYREMLGGNYHMPCLQSSQNFLSSQQINEKILEPYQKRFQAGEWIQYWVSGVFCDRKIREPHLPIPWKSSPTAPVSYITLREDNQETNRSTNLSYVSPSSSQTWHAIIIKKMRTQSIFRALISVEGESVPGLVRLDYIE